MLAPAHRNLLVAIGVLILFVGMLIWSAEIPDPRGREFPMLVSAAAVVLCLLDVIAGTDTVIGRSLASVLSVDAASWTGAPTHGTTREVLALAWIAGATALIILVGFLAALPLYVLGYMTLYAHRSVGQSAITALATTLCIWAGFELLLSYELYRGLLFAAL